MNKADITRDTTLPFGKMNPVLKAAWVEALRSGNYEQGQAQLCKGGRHCCLGVLEEVAAEALGTEIVIENHDGFADIKRYNGNTGLPSITHTEFFFGSEVHNIRTIPRVIIDNKQMSLSAHNDNGQSFNAIANAIEEQL